MASSAMQLAVGFDLQDTLNAKVLKPLDEALRCHICFEYFNNCMITKCSHNYCSVCIRRYMVYKSQCPTCFQVATEPELQNNRLIDEILRIYKKIRETLQISCDTENKLSTEQPSCSRVNCDESVKIPIKADKSIYVPSVQSSTQNAAKDVASDEVACPVCYLTVQSDRINIHLDSCLKQSEDRNQRKFLPKLVYHLLTDKQIKKKLKDHGLSVSGDRQTLIRRHKNFLVLYNANCDSISPKPVSELLLEIERQELEEKISVSQRNTPINKKSDPSIIEKEIETYARKHQSQFNALIHDVQQRELSRISVKKELNSSTESLSSNITDEFGSKIGESSLQIDNSPHFEIFLKQELSDSPPPDTSRDTVVDRDGNIAENDLVGDKNKVSEMQSNTSQLPFRIKKEVSFKVKEDSPSLIDMRADQDLVANSPPSSLDDFETSKM